MKKIELKKDEWGGCDLRAVMSPMETAEFKLTTTNKCYVRDIPAGISKNTGKPYNAFKIYSISAGIEGEDEAVFIKLPNAAIARQVESFSVGDVLVLTCVPHTKGKSFVIEKKEE